jgi:polyhydroxyalkanoate synthesis regulator phasin
MASAFAKMAMKRGGKMAMKRGGKMAMKRGGKFAKRQGKAMVRDMKRNAKAEFERMKAQGRGQMQQMAAQGQAAMMQQAQAARAAAMQQAQAARAAAQGRMPMNAISFGTTNLNQAQRMVANRMGAMAIGRQGGNPVMVGPQGGSFRLNPMGQRMPMLPGGY